MDYSSNSDNDLGESGRPTEAPDEINESFDFVEPEFTEIELELASPSDVQDDGPIATDQTNQDSQELNPIKPADLKPSFHSQPDGMEVPGSPETQPLNRSSIRDLGMRGEGLRGNPEGRY